MMRRIVNHIARESELDAGTMTRLLDRLEAKQQCQRAQPLPSKYRRY